MISDLTIENYESHHKTSLKFGPGITGVAGATDVGKSAIRRSIEWVCLNRPLGMDFISWGQNKTVVTLDGVSKSRSSKAHVYEVGGHKYKAFRAEVPAPVYDKLKISEYNFQRQHNPYFLLNDSPGQVARTLNDVTNLTLIDKVLKEGRSRLSAADWKVTLLVKQQEEKLKEVKELEWSVQAKIDLQEIIDAQFAITVMEDTEKTWSQAVSAACTAQDEMNRYPNIDFDITLLIQTGRRLDPTKMNLLEQTIDSVHQAENLGLEDVPMDLKTVNTILPRLDKNDMFHLSESLRLVDICTKDIKGLTHVDIDLERVINVETKIHASKQIVVKMEDILRVNEECNEVTARYEKSKERFESEFKRLGMCPLCDKEYK